MCYGIGWKKGREISEMLPFYFLICLCSNSVHECVPRCSDADEEKGSEDVWNQGAKYSAAIIIS